LTRADASVAAPADENTYRFDYYPGTHRPAQFRSRVTVRADGKDTPAVIEMNRGLAFAGYRFFQSSYRETPGRDMTILSVSRDPGEAIVFLGYYGVVIGMLVVFATRIGHRRAMAAAAASAGALLLLVAPASAQSVPDATDVEALRRLPVQHDGRVMPFDTLARESVFNITGRRAIFGRDPVAVALGMAFDPEGWAVQPIVPVDASLGAAIGLQAGTPWASFADLVRNGTLGQLVQSARALEAEERPVGGLAEGRAEDRGPAAGDEALLGRSALTVVPAGGAPWAVPSPLNSIAALRAVQVAGLAGPAASREAIEREIIYNAARPTRIAWWILALSLALSLAAWRTEKRALDAAALATLVLGFAAMSWGIGMRWKVAGHIPASNMYESLLFLGWGVGLFALVASLLVRNRLVVFNAAAMSTLTMMLTDLLPIDPFLHPMPPVLAGTYWLAVHVPIIMVGYAVLALGVAVAHMQIGAEIFAPKNRELSQRMNDLLYWYVMAGSILLLVGILTGSMWAAESWGDYWGWDPKEVWSLVAFLAYMAILHARVEKLIGPFGMAAWSVVAFQIILMTYLGVNFVLASGLHSYGFGESHVVQGMAAVLAGEKAFVLGGLVHRAQAPGRASVGEGCRGLKAAPVVRGRSTLRGRAGAGSADSRSAGPRCSRDGALAAPSAGTRRSPPDRRP